MLNVIFTFGFGKGMVWHVNEKFKETSNCLYVIPLLENSQYFINSIPFNLIQFHFPLKNADLKRVGSPRPRGTQLGLLLKIKQSLELNDVLDFTIKAAALPRNEFFASKPVVRKRVFSAATKHIFHGTSFSAAKERVLTKRVFSATKKRVVTKRVAVFLP